MSYRDKQKTREYNQQYHLKTWSERKERHSLLKNKRRTYLAQWLRDYKNVLSCIICNENHPACLDFHHVNKLEKEGTVANMISEGYSLKRVKHEISKCIVLCKNCHAKKHYGNS